MTSNMSASPVICQVTLQTQSLSEIARELTEIVVELDKNLSSVMRARPPKLESTGSPAEEVLVPLANELRETWKILYSVAAVLREMNGALELPR